MEQMMAKDLLKPLILKALWLTCSASFDQLVAGQVGQQQGCTPSVGWQWCCMFRR